MFRDAAGSRRSAPLGHRAIFWLVAACILTQLNSISAFAVSRGITSASSRLLSRLSRRCGATVPGVVSRRRMGATPPSRRWPSTAAVVCSTLRGGHLKSNAERAAVEGQEDDGGVSTDDKAKKTLMTVAAVASVALAAWKRNFLLSSFRALRSADLKTWLIGRLDAVNDLGTPGLVIYSFLFALYEILVGITTPVETAAGMAFGVRRGIVASAVGKIGGAITAYFIGHYLLQDYVKKKLEGNELMDLVEDSIRENPVGVALIWRFSFLPEFVKNFGLSVLPIKPIHFMTAVFLHGFPFTCLWTFMGAETGALARGIVSEPSRTLKILVSGVYVFGFFISPTLVGMWVKSLKDRQTEKRNA